MSESINIGTQGAKVQSFADNSPRKLLRQIMDAHPGADKEDIYKSFRHAVIDDPEMMDVILLYWFANNYVSLTMRPMPMLSKRKRKEQSTASIKAMTETITRNFASMFLLNTKLPNGKTLGDTTFGECAKLGGKLNKIAKQGNPRQLVRTVLTNDQLKALQT